MGAVAPRKGLSPVDLLTVDELAAALRISRSAVYVSRHRGDLPGSLAVKLGRRLYFRREDLERLFDEQVERVRAGDAA